MARVETPFRASQGQRNNFYIENNDMRHEKVSLFKFIDHWVGGPICLGLALLNRIFHPLYKRHLCIPKESLPPGHILIVKFFGLGSITLSSALIANIRRAYKDCKIIFLTFKDNVPIIKTMGLADEILVIETKNPFVMLQSICRALSFCYSQKIDIAMDIEFYSKFSTIMSFLSGAPLRMGFFIARFWRDSLVNVPIYFNYSRHILEIYGMFAQSLQIENQDIYPKDLIITDDKRENVLGFLERRNIPHVKNFIGLNIHASDVALCRRWPLPKFVALVEQFLAHYPQWDIILTGSKGERCYADEFLNLLKPQDRQRIINLTGELDLDQFLALLSQLPLFITNDTGPFHLAKAVGTRTISLWGPGSIDLYGPYKEEKDFHEVIYKRFPCSPCLYVYRTDPGFFCAHKALCMQAIEPLDVMTLIHQRLNERA
ncbi:MAG: glycosyltransferase family 9 protein [Candidatus Omnitrophica bacterium]|nr:glycosyltransferase family 9 protein [Candidatus Omnitrophota bacterium]